jgi:hypothetical protein
VDIVGICCYLDVLYADLEVEFLQSSISVVEQALFERGIFPGMGERAPLSGPMSCS